MKVSVCIPTYNQSEYLIKAIDSVLSQTVMPYEIIVSNDCSTDNTTGVLQKLSELIPILKVIHQEKNLGISHNTDKCLRAATGDFIVRLDSDDLLSSEYIERLSSQLIAYPNAAYAHGAIQEIDHHGNFLQQRMLARKPGFQSGNEALLAARKGYKVAANIVMFRHSALKSVNYSSGRPSYVEDFHLSASLAAAGFGNVYQNEILAFYRVWTDNGMTRQRRKLLEITGVRKVFEEVLEPSYLDKNWDLKQLYKQRESFAKSLSDCLSWNVYSRDEKLELAKELTRLSSSIPSQLFAWLYLNGFKHIIHAYSKPLNLIKLTVKIYLIKYLYTNR